MVDLDNAPRKAHDGWHGKLFPGLVLLVTRKFGADAKIGNAEP